MLRPFILICVFAAPACLGQAQSPITCTAESVKPMIVSVEGVAELVSDYVVQCRGGAPTPAGQSIPRVTFQAFLNSTVTSKPLAPSPDAPLTADEPPPAGPPHLSEALLLIDEPKPNVQLPCPALPCSIQGTGGATSPYDGSAGHYNVFQAAQTYGNILEWARVPFDAPGPTATRLASVRPHGLRA